MKKVLISTGLSLFVLVYACSVKPPDSLLEAGVSKELAAMRGDQISNVNYLLYISLTGETGEKADASLVLEFFMSDASHPVIVDFHKDESYLLSVFHKGETLPYSYKNGHIIIDKKYFEAGQQQLEFHFTLPESALLATENYLLLNPAAKSDFPAFPAFKQADLPASFLLNMEIPAGFKALSNAAVLKETQVSGRLSVAFAKTPIIAADEFSFVVGQLSKAEYMTKGKTLDFYYAGNNIPDSTRLALYAAEFVKQDTIAVSQFNFSPKTDLVILPDLKAEIIYYMPGLVYFGNY